jgi:hypothetical protein
MGGRLNDFRWLDNPRRQLGLLVFPCPNFIVFLKSYCQTPISAQSWMGSEGTDFLNLYKWQQKTELDQAAVCAY